MTTRTPTSVEEDPTIAMTSHLTEHENDSEQGYVLPMTALLLIPMMIIAALAVDVGGFYVKGQQIQRATDAAALAAVVWMPDEATATQVALDVAARNGFADATPLDQTDFDDPNAPLPQVRVTRTGAQRLEVAIRDEGTLYFGAVVTTESPDMTRSAEAEYILPVPMGNPTSALGTGVDTGYGPAPDNFWLRAMPTCEIRINGDPVGAGQIEPSYASYGNPTPCDLANPPNPNHIPEGHAFIVDIPADAMGNPVDNYVVQARVTCWVQRRVNGAGNEYWAQGDSNGQIRARLYEPDLTPLNDYDNIVNDPFPDQTTVLRSGNGTCGNAGDNASPLNWLTAGPNPGDRTGDPAPWVDLGNVITQPGRWVMYIKNDYSETSGNTDIRRANYSLRIVTQAAATANTDWSCSRIGPGAYAECPNLYARDFMTAHTAGTMYFDGQIAPPGPLFAELYMAEIAEVHAGKTLEIKMFDPADGIEIVRILDPSGNVVPVQWETIDQAEFGYDSPDPLWSADNFADIPLTSQTCGGTSCIASNPDSGPGGFNFQDRTIRILVDLPDTYTCQTIAAQPDNCWWRVQYEDSNSNATETTTWSVRVLGDPVRLTD